MTEKIIAAIIVSDCVAVGDSEGVTVVQKMNLILNIHKNTINKLWSKKFILLYNYKSCL